MIIRWYILALGNKRCKDNGLYHIPGMTGIVALGNKWCKGNILLRISVIHSILALGNKWCKDNINYITIIL